MVQRRVALPAACSARALSASLSSRPSATSASSRRSQFAASNSANQARSWCSSVADNALIAFSICSIFPMAQSNLPKRNSTTRPRTLPYRYRSRKRSVSGISSRSQQAPLLAGFDISPKGCDHAARCCEGLHTRHPRSRCRLTGGHRWRVRTAVSRPKIADSTRSRSPRQDRADIGSTNLHHNGVTSRRSKARHRRYQERQSH